MKNSFLSSLLTLDVHEKKKEGTVSGLERDFDMLYSNRDDGNPLKKKKRKKTQGETLGETKRSRRNRTPLVDFRRKVSRRDAAEERGGVKVDAARRKPECVIRQRLTLFKGAASERGRRVYGAARLAFAFCTRRTCRSAEDRRSLARSRGRCTGDGMDGRLPVQPRREPVRSSHGLRRGSEQQPRERESRMP